MIPPTDVGYCPVKLGMMSSRLQNGVNTLQGFREDKRNQITLGKYCSCFGFCVLISHRPVIRTHPAQWDTLFRTVKSWWWSFIQCPTSTMVLIPPTHPPTTPALETSVRRSLTSSILLLETSPVCSARTSMWHHSTFLANFSPGVLLDIWPICFRGGQLSAVM